MLSAENSSRWNVQPSNGLPLPGSDWDAGGPVGYDRLMARDMLAGTRIGLVPVMLVGLAVIAVIAVAISDWSGGDGGGLPAEVAAELTQTSTPTPTATASPTRTPSPVPTATPVPKRDNALEASLKDLKRGAESVLDAVPDIDLPKLPCSAAICDGVDSQEALQASSWSCDKVTGLEWDTVRGWSDDNWIRKSLANLENNCTILDALAGHPEGGEFFEIIVREQAKSMLEAVTPG